MTDCLHYDRALTTMIMVQKPIRTSSLPVVLDSGRRKTKRRGVVIAEGISR